MCYDVWEEIEGKESGLLESYFEGEEGEGWERGWNGLFRIKKDFDWGYDFLFTSNYDRFNE